MNIDLTLSSLQDKGFRLTKIRREMVRIFAEKSCPLTAKELEEILENANLSVNKTTVYRELKFLVNNGYIVEVHILPNEVSYESSELKHHHHLVCDICGRVDSFTKCFAKELEGDIYQKKGFKIKRHTFELYGTCANCERKN